MKLAIHLRPKQMTIMCRSSTSDSVVPRLWTGQSDNWDSVPGRVRGLFLFVTATMPLLRPIHIYIHWITAALSQRVKQPGCEAGHSPAFNAED